MPSLAQTPVGFEACIMFMKPNWYTIEQLLTHYAGDKLGIMGDETLHSRIPILSKQDSIEAYA